MKIRFFILLMLLMKLNFVNAQHSKVCFAAETIFNKNVTDFDWTNTKYRAGSFGVNITYPLLERKKITLATGISYQNLSVKTSWGAVSDILGESYLLELSRINRFSIPLFVKYCISDKKAIKLLGIIEQSMYQNINRKQFVANDKNKAKSFISNSQESLYTSNANRNILQLGLGVEKDITIAKRRFTISLFQLNDVQSIRLKHLNYSYDGTSSYIQEKDIKISSTTIKISTNIF